MKNHPMKSALKTGRDGSNNRKRSLIRRKIARLFNKIKNSFMKFALKTGSRDSSANKKRSLIRRRIARPFDKLKDSIFKSVPKADDDDSANKQQAHVHPFEKIKYSVLNFKTTFSDYHTIKAAYDPYQMKQQADESGFDPYFRVPETDNMEIDEKIDINNDAQDNFFDECLPATRQITAFSTIGSAVDSLAWGTMAAVHFVYTSTPVISSLVTASFTTRTTKSTTEFSSNTNSMRGFGIDFAAIAERSPEMKRNMEDNERHIRVLCLEANEAMQQEANRRRMASLGGDPRFPLRRSIDDTWGFVEKNYCIKFKPTISPPKPLRRVHVT